MNTLKGLFILACLVAIASAKPQQDSQKYQLLKRQYDNVELPAEGRLSTTKLQALLAALGKPGNPTGTGPTATTEIEIDSEPSTIYTEGTETSYTTPTLATISPTTTPEGARSQNDFDDDEDQERNLVDNFDVEEEDVADDEIEAFNGHSLRNGQSGMRNALARQRQQFQRQQQQQQRRRQKQNAQRRRRQRQEQQRRRRQRLQNQRRRQNMRNNVRLINSLRQNRNRNGNRNRNVNRRVIRIPA